MKWMYAALTALLLAGAVLAQVDAAPQHSYVSQAGFVPDAETAVRIAVAVLSPMYGEREIKAEAPFVATLKNGVWTVVGTLPAGLNGGVALIEISKTSGTVLRVSHGK